MNTILKKTMICLGSFVLALVSFSSCEDMLTIDSTRYASVEDNTLSSPNDSVHSVLGILRQLQNVADRYVLLGEMRADLLDVTEYTPAAIRELSNYTVSETNTYANPRDYYAIINNCNYFISRTSDAGSPLEKENALIHAIRAWTYMQVAFNWGKVYYITEPLLTVNDIEKAHSEYDISQLADELIADLEPFAEAAYPNYGTIYNFSSEKLFFPVKVLLGDLYLWRGASTADYETAAKYYAEYIDSHKSFYIGANIRWSYDNFQNNNFETSRPINYGWTSIISAVSGNPELITAIQMAEIQAQGKTSGLSGNFIYFGISEPLVELWDAQSYVLLHQPDGGGIPVVYPTTGDCRKYGNILGNAIISSGSGETTIPALTKIFNADHILLYRLGLIWLRYAEAVNRAGKPHTAFAVLKYGLNPLTFTDEAKIPPNERIGAPYIEIFNNEKYALINEEGIHARGCGDSAYDPNYLMGDTTMTAPEDTVLNVERLICDELAMETSFEGNRMQDLIRLALRRNDNAFLAKRIAAKHSAGDYDRIYNLLVSDTKNWFLPEPKK